MKVSWHNLSERRVVAVTHELSEASVSAWVNRGGKIREFLNIAPNDDLLNALARRFSLGPDITYAQIEGSMLTTEASCPASAWLFNRNIDAMLRYAVTERPPQVDQGAVDPSRFGFQTGPADSWGSQFLEDARQAGYDIIRTSVHFPNYVIRDLNGNKISVSQNFTDLTSHIATRSSTNKLVAAEMLTLAGLPTPRTYKVSSENEVFAVFKRKALSAAVIKPMSTDRGLGVHTSLRTEAELSAAFNGARRFGEVIMQEYVDGDDFRVLVADGAVMGVTQRAPFSVVGDGSLTILELLIEKVKWRSSHRFYKHFNKISAHDSDTQLMLQKQGLTYESIPAQDQRVILRSNANVSTGGEHEDVTEQCHPEVKQLAIECAELFGLDLAGIDYLSTDITRSWKDVSGKICEINPTPALSVDGVPSKIFSRFHKMGPAVDPQNSIGDLLCIRNCTCKSLPDLRLKYKQHAVIDLTTCSEAQYFFQSFLVTQNSNYLLVVTSEFLNKYGLVNSNARAVLFCETCLTSGISKPTITASSPYELTEGLF